MRQWPKSNQCEVFVHAIYNIQSNPTQGQKIMQFFLSNIEEWCAILPSKSMKYKKKGLIGT